MEEGHESKRKFLVVVHDGPNHLIGKTAYWESNKRTFGRQDLFDLFGDFVGLERVSREHLTIKKLDDVKEKIYKDKLEIIDNNSTHGSRIEIHPYASFVEGLYDSKDVWIIELASVLKISIGSGFGITHWAGAKNYCEYCWLPIDFSNVCEICFKSKPVNTVIIEPQEKWKKEKLVTKLTLVPQESAPDGTDLIPGLTLSRNGEKFDLSVSEIQKIYDLMQNEFSYHHRMCSIYYDRT